MYLKPARLLRFARNDASNGGHCEFPTGLRPTRPVYDKRRIPRRTMARRCPFFLLEAQRRGNRDASAASVAIRIAKISFNIELTKRIIRDGFQRVSEKSKPQLKLPCNLRTGKQRNNSGRFAVFRQPNGRESRISAAYAGALAVNFWEEQRKSRESKALYDPARRP